jgi:tetratricopeptide (TPR) repeat protein
MYLWTATYERQLISVFAIQDEIAANVAEALQLELFGGTSPRSDARRTNNVEAHDAYLLGKHHMLTRRIEDIRKAQDYFQRAVELDSDYALAYGILGGSFMALYDRGVIGFEAMLAGAERSVNRAIQLGPELGEAYAYRALLLERKGDAAGSERDFLKSIELNPNFAETYFWYSLRLRDLGRFAEAREMIQAAFDLDPLSPIINHWFGRTLAIDGNLDEARAYFRRTNEIEPSYAAVYFSWATVEIQAGRLADGLSLLRTATALDARIPRHAEFVAFTYVSLGDLEQAQVWFDRAASLQADQNRALFLGEFIPLVLQLQDTDRLTSILMGQSLHIRRDVDDQDMWSALFRLAALRNGEVATARQLFSRLWPELLGPGQAQVNLRNFEEAVDIAWLLREEGDSERANQLLNEALAVLEDVPPGVVPFEIVKVRVLALLGREAQALLTFRTAIDEGWRLLTWTLEADPALASLRGDPEFQAMVEEIESDLAVQRERVQEMERNGELAPMPDLVPSE